MKKETIVFIGLGVATLVSICLNAYQKNQLTKANETILELRYSNSKTIVKYQKLEVDYLKEIESANFYKSQYENYEQKLDSIFYSSLSASDKTVADYFTSKKWRRQYKDVDKRFKMDKSAINSVR